MGSNWVDREEAIVTGQGRRLEKVNSFALTFTFFPLGKKHLDLSDSPGYCKSQYLGTMVLESKIAKKLGK